MKNNKPKFVIIGSEDNIHKVLNKLPNKNKYQYHYLLGVDTPLIEYSFFLDREDEENNIGEFSIIVCLNQELLNLIQFNDITSLIVCHNNNNYISTNKINVKEIIHIWFDTPSIPYNNYKFDNNEWIHKIYNHLDIPYTAPPNMQCNII
jgi:hypothetical protein